MFTRQLLELHRGQGLDIHWRDTYTCPTESQYRTMVLQKTGGLFGLAVGLMQLFSGWKRDLKVHFITLTILFSVLLLMFQHLEFHLLNLFGYD